MLNSNTHTGSLRSKVVQKSNKKIVAGIDAKPVYDAINSERSGGSRDKRVAVELNLLRHECEQDNVIVKWVPTRQQLADPLTKETALGNVGLQHTSTVIRNGLWTLGPDPRSPPDNRNRSVANEFIKGNLELKAPGEDGGKDNEFNPRSVLIHAFTESIVAESNFAPLLLLSHC